jgi:hypothetical protein
MPAKIRVSLFAGKEMGEVTNWFQATLIRPFLVAINDKMMVRARRNIKIEKKVIGIESNPEMKMA